MVPAVAPEVVDTPRYSRELLLSALATSVEEPATTEREASATPPPLFTIQMRKGGGTPVALKAPGLELPGSEALTPQWPPPPPVAPPAVGEMARAGMAEPPPPPSQAVPDSPPRKVPGLRVEAPEFVPLKGVADQAAEPKPLRTPLSLAATIADPGVAGGSSTASGLAATPKSPARHSAAAPPPPPALWPGLAPWPGQSPGINSLFTAAAAAAAATAVVAAGFAAAAQQRPSTPGRQQPPAGWPNVEAASATAACPDAKASPVGNASRKLREEPPKTPLTGRGKVLSLDEHVASQSPAAHKVGGEPLWGAWGPMMSPGWFPQGSPTASPVGSACTPGGLAGLLGAPPMPHDASKGRPE